MLFIFNTYKSSGYQSVLIILYAGISHPKENQSFLLVNPLAPKVISLLAFRRTPRLDPLKRHNNSRFIAQHFFNSVEFPQMTFVSISAKHIESGRFEVVGDLTIHGVKKRVTVSVECSSISKLGGKTRAGFEASFEIKRSDFGVSYGVEKKVLGDETRIIVSLEGIEPGSAPKRKE